jgi:hypothetical protein
MGFFRIKPHVPYLLHSNLNMNLCFDVTARLGHELAARLEEYRGMQVWLTCQFLSFFPSLRPFKIGGVSREVRKLRLDTSFDILF